MKEQIPSEFFEKNNLMGFYYILHGLVLWLGLGYAAAWVYDVESIPWLARVACAVVCVLLAGLALTHLGTMSHEGFHGNINKNRDLSMLLGVLASSAVPFFLGVGFTVSHWQHHLYTSTEKDPDYVMFKKHGDILSRFANGPMSVRTYLNNVLIILFSKEDFKELRYPFSSGKAKFFALFNLLAAALALGVYVVFAIHNPHLFLFMVLFPYLVVSAYMAVLPYMEHAGLRPDGKEITRTYSSFIFTMIFLGINFHREHHLYPSVQIHKLPKLHCYLKQHGKIPDDAPIELGFWRALKIGVTARYQ